MFSNVVKLFPDFPLINEYLEYKFSNVRFDILDLKE